MLVTGGLVSLPRIKRSRVRILPTLLVILIFSYQLVINIIILRTSKGEVLRQAGLAVAEVSDERDFIFVLSDNPAVDRGVPNNFEQPDVFFHSRRRGRVLPYDQQSSRGMADALQGDMKWFVNFPNLNSAAHPSFFEYLDENMQIYSIGDGYEIYLILPSPDRKSPTGFNRCVPAQDREPVGTVQE
jgi:hypothetical protein